MTSICPDHANDGLGQPALPTATVVAANVAIVAPFARARWAIVVVVLLAVTGCIGIQGDEPCETSELEQATGFPETRGEGAEAWALLWVTPPWEVGQDVKVVWRMAGSGDFEVRAVGPEGEIVAPTSGPTSHASSNWDRPGPEWGTFFTLPTEGCWQLEAQRSDAISTITIDVINP